MFQSRLPGGFLYSLMTKNRRKAKTGINAKCWFELATPVLIIIGQGLGVLDLSIWEFVVALSATAKSSR